MLFACHAEFSRAQTLGAPMRVLVHHTPCLNGQITPPSSKSQTIRALIFGLLSSGTTQLQHCLDSEDIDDAIRMIKALGGQLDRSGSALSLESNGPPFNIAQNILNTGNSGITTHFILPLLGLRHNHEIPMIVDCGNQMRARPMNALIQALRDLGMKIDGDSFPIQITGRLLGGRTVLDSHCSQPLSALLIALPLAEQDSVIHLKNRNEWPYIEMTLAWLKKQNMQIIHEGEYFYIQGKQRYQAFDYTVPGDYSSASTFLAASKIFPGHIQINGLDPEDLQGDKDILKYLPPPLRGTQINASNIPDLLPTLAVLGTVFEGQTQIMNVPHARLKETDRIHSMTQGLRRMGATIEELPDGMTITQSTLQGAPVNGYHDHRTVMALTLAGMLAQGTTLIEHAESVNKTYPSFFDDLIRLGANLEIQDA
jgi:3-phosphoshikimate 1-carboxyvinyltransferase